MRDDPEQRQNIAKDKPKVVKRLFDLVLADAKGGPILPNDPEFNEESQAWLYRR